VFECTTGNASLFSRDDIAGADEQQWKFYLHLRVFSAVSLTLWLACSEAVRFTFQLGFF
jgi:hypothetical protein